MVVVCWCKGGSTEWWLEDSFSDGGDDGGLAQIYLMGLVFLSLFNLSLDLLSSPKDVLVFGVISKLYCLSKEPYKYLAWLLTIIPCFGKDLKHIVCTLSTTYAL